VIWISQIIATKSEKLLNYKKIKEIPVNRSAHSKKGLLYVSNLDYGQFAFSWSLEPAAHFLSVCGFFSAVAPVHGFPDGNVHCSSFLADADPTNAGAITSANTLTIAIVANIVVFVFITAYTGCLYKRMTG
jgi:hypothetical protein